MGADPSYVPAMSPPGLMTAEELLHTHLPDKKVELVRGVLLVREPTGYRHGAVSATLTRLLANHVDPGRREARVYRQDGSETVVREGEALQGEDGVPGFDCELGAVLKD